mgnify:CR=1 FL=1
MSFKTLKKISNWILYPTVLFWLVENMVFGWNQKPLSESEIICDTIVNFGIITYFFILIIRINKTIDFITELEDEK